MSQLMVVEVEEEWVEIKQGNYFEKLPVFFASGITQIKIHSAK